MINAASTTNGTTTRLSTLKCHPRRLRPPAETMCFLPLILMKRIRPEFFLSSPARPQLEPREVLQALPPVGPEIVVREVAFVRARQDGGQFLQLQQVGVERINE